MRDKMGKGGAAPGLLTEPVEVSGGSLSGLGYSQSTRVLPS